MFHQTSTKNASFVTLIIGAIVYTTFTGYFGKELIIEASILAILVMSLDMVAGYGGMVSLCHGAIFGLGAYIFGITTTLLGLPPAIGILAAIVTAGIFGFAVGGITSKTSGIFFIMATLAFGQMVYVLIFDASILGGDDGMSGIPRLDLSLFGIDMNDSLTFAIFTVAIAAVIYLLIAYILRSGFGRTLVGIRSNETRVRAIGLDVWKYKATAFAMSGAVAGLAGSLAAQHTMFISPQMLVWTVSGEALIVVILGGLGTLIGPAWGAFLFVFLKHEISSYTTYWHLVIGVVLIVTVILGNRGIFGQIEYMIDQRRARKNNPNKPKEEKNHA